MLITDEPKWNRNYAPITITLVFSEMATTFMKS